MIDRVAIREALRQRLLSLVVATTGATDLGASAAGYTRPAGSFVADGFAPGMEVLPAGFANNAPRVVDTVDDALLKIVGGIPAQTTGAGRSVTVGLPEAQQWENTQTPYPVAPGTRPYVAEQFVPGPFTLISFPAEGGDVEQSGLYVITWYGLSNRGVLAMYRQIDALVLLFAPGTVLLTGPNAVRITSGPDVGQLIPLENGYVTCQVRVPWRGISTNAIAAA